MKKISIIVIILFFPTVALLGLWFQQELKMPKEVSLEEQFKNLDLIILKNTEFKNFGINRFSFKYPNWTEIEIEPQLIWPEEIAREERILLYLTNPDGIKILVTKRELSPQDLSKPYPLLFRETFTKEREIMEREGGLTNLQVIREDFFENGIVLELKSSIFGMPITSISKSIILRNGGVGFIYSVGISGPEKTFEDYKLLTNYIIDSIYF